MTTIKLITQDQQLMLISHATVASGTRQTVRVTVKTDSRWDGYEIYASFWRDSERETILDEPLIHGECLIPPYMLTRAGTLYISIWGNNETGDQKTSTTVTYRIKAGSPVDEGTTLIDVRGTTAEAAMVMKGETFYASDGTLQTGAMEFFDEGNLFEENQKLNTALDEINGEVI